MISETALISILGVAGMLLSGVLSFVLGKRSERKRQSLAVRAEMLRPIEDWLRGTERMIAILGDTLTSVMLNTPLPAMYDLEERRKAAQFMSERRNVVFGILQSKALQTGRVKKQSNWLLLVSSLTRNRHNSGVGRWFRLFAANVGCTSCH